MGSQASSLADAYRLAEFMLNPPPTPTPPSRQSVEEYVRQHFTCPDGGYSFSSLVVRASALPRPEALKRLLRAYTPIDPHSLES